MTILRLKTLSVACVALIATAVSAGQPVGNTALLKRIQEAIASIRAMEGPPSMRRTNEAERLSNLTEKINPERVDDKTMRSLISLLNDAPDDSVRLWVASAIGNLGPRAKSAAAALLRDIRDTDCVPLAEMTSAGAARVALKRIGLKPPDRNCGGKCQ